MLLIEFYKRRRHVLKGIRSHLNLNELAKFANVLKKSTSHCSKTNPIKDCINDLESQFFMKSIQNEETHWMSSVCRNVYLDLRPQDIEDFEIQFRQPWALGHLREQNLTRDSKNSKLIFKKIVSKSYVMNPQLHLNTIL